MMNGVPARCKYPSSVREFCLKMCYFSPRAYEVLRSTLEKTLPGRTTIRAWYAHSCYSNSPGINYNILKLIGKRAADKKAMGDELICSLLVDEMHIRQHAQWCGQSKTMLGFPSYGRNSSNDVLASQAIVFMLVGVNERLQSAIAYHFIASLNGQQRSELIKTVVNSILEYGIKILNVTSDGLPANQTMYEALGAILDHCSNSYQPFMCFSHEKIYIIKDPPHMMKLVRNMYIRIETSYI